MKFLILLFSILAFNVEGSPFTFYTSKSGLINSDVHCIVGGEKFIWIGTTSGINRVLFQGKKAVQFSKRGTSVPVTALENDGDILWTGLKGKGVYQMIKKNYKLIGFRKDILGDKEIINIKRIKKGLIVFTLSQKFSFVFGKEKYSVVDYVNKEYNPTLKVKDKILKINNGGLSRYNPETKSFRPFKYFIEARDAVNWDNGVLIATSKGLVFYNPENDTIRFGTSKLELLEFKLNNIDTNPGELDLNWGKHTFNFSFTFEELGSPSKISLFYTLKNDDELMEKTVPALGGIKLSDLEYGTYNLSVIAKNDIGIVSKNKLNYRFSIANPLRDSIWRYIIIMLSIIIWTIIVTLIVKARFKKDMVVLEDALLEKTNKLNQIEKSRYGLVDEDEVNL